MGNVALRQEGEEFNATTEMASLIALALWSIPLNHIPNVARASRYGIEWNMSNRDQSTLYYDKNLSIWIGRADRTKANHHDNLPMIAIVILAVTILGRTDEFTANASVVILISRIFHSFAYLYGITGMRSFAYYVSIGALLSIVFRAWSMPPPNTANLWY